MKNEVHEEVLGRLHVALDCVDGETQPGPQIEVKAHKKSQSPFFISCSGEADKTSQSELRKSDHR